MEAVLLHSLERERGRVASALRSETAQVLTSVLLGLTAAGQADDLAEVRATIEDLRTAVRSDLERVQALAFAIRPSLLDDFGLAAALHALTASLGAKDGLSIEVAFVELPRALPPAEQSLVFRTLEEAVRNALRHSHASRITVSLAGTPAELEFEVRDDGSGFDGESGSGLSSGPSGLALMHAQARALGGSLEIVSKPGVGTRVLLRIPRGGTTNE